MATRYAELLCGIGIDRGVIGPREAPKVWERHLLNCAIASDAVEEHATVADVGSGAGLPGLAWSIRRPDLQVVLIDSLLRRTTFLSECVRELGLEARASVTRGRVEEWAGGSFDVVTSRAVAPLERLVRWCAPLCRPGGRVVALKGTAAEDEVAASAKTIARVSDSPPRLKTYGSDVLEEPTTVVEIGVDRPLGAAH
ncbi:16S rRNA (guanine(527)-N(7))-methyltransferase RsmG [Nocardioidaceae bacterium SCSIO 66511]|nr:16S rRNA (guanine(527)-N(7))-methyltransferase RsmG [Nocardioidaceae bacterium SCSIO 66511]